MHVEYLQVHEIGEDYAEVTEGNPWPIGYVWERLHYDWSDPQALRGRVIDSNLFKPGSTWELRATLRTAVAGWRSAPYVTCAVEGGCSPRSSSHSRFVSAAASVREHLRHFLGSIDAPIGDDESGNA